jgi:hypothetical protein
MGQSKKYNPEKLATRGTHDKEKKTKPKHNKDNTEKLTT